MKKSGVFRGISLIGTAILLLVSYLGTSLCFFDISGVPVVRICLGDISVPSGGGEKRSEFRGKQSRKRECRKKMKFEAAIFCSLDFFASS